MDSEFLPESSLIPAPAPINFRDRSGGLMACGIIQIILGGLAALGIPFVLLGALVSSKAGAAMPAGTYFLSIISYAITAAALITLGVGSIRVRRWARALTLIVSWGWLVVGILMTVLLTAVMPAAFSEGFRRAAQANPAANSMPTGIIAAVLTFVIVLFTVFLVIIPSGFLLFYSRKDVLETFQFRDPSPGWTDRCPLPVLAASLMYGYGAGYYLLTSFSAPLVPFFGRYLTGIPGALGCLVLTALGAYLAVSLFRLQLTAWWVAVVVLVVRIISAILTNLHADLLQAYSRMGWGHQTLHEMSNNPMLRGKVMLWWSVGYMVVFLGYLLWLRRYFPPPRTTGPTPSEAPVLPLA